MKYFFLSLLIACQEEYHCEEWVDCKQDDVECSQNEILLYKECEWTQVCEGVIDDRYYSPAYLSYKWVRSNDVNRVYNCDLETSNCIGSVVDMATEQCPITNLEQN